MINRFELIDNDFYLSFGGPITFERASRLRKVVQELPLEYILVETDAPDQPGAIADSQRNEPAFITEVIQTIAGLQQIDYDEVAATTADTGSEPKCAGGEDEDDDDNDETDTTHHQTTTTEPPLL